MKIIIELSEEQIKSIAEELDAGMRCFYHKDTKEIKSVIDLDRHIYADEELWEESINEIDREREKYIEFKALSSKESYSIMKDFALSLEDKKMQERLLYALDKPKPFGNFKYEIDYSEEYRDLWFKFKNKRYIDRVKEQIDEFNSVE
jgi:hypothetical protein